MDENKKAVLIYGPESTGNRLMKRLLASNGFGVTNDDIEPNRLSFEKAWMVHGHSIPANGLWLNLIKPRKEFEARNYNTYTLILFRDFHATIHSQVGQGRVNTLDDAIYNTRKAYEHIFNQMLTDYIPVSFDNLIRYPRKVLNYIGDYIDAPIFITEEIKDANAKYFS